MSTIYGSSVADGTLTTAGACSATTGGTETTKGTTGCSGAASTYIEVRATGGAATAGVSSLPSPSGKGWVYYPGAGTFAAGNWSAVINFAETFNFTAGSWTIRFYTLSGGVYTSIGTIAIASPAITTSKKQFSFSATSMSSVTLASGDALYFDLWLRGGGSAWGSDTLTIYESNSSSAGVANDMQVTTATFTLAGSTPSVSFVNGGSMLAGYIPAYGGSL
jgi:hypothetical protein